jgi:hypothetical protein
VENPFDKSQEVGLGWVMGGLEGGGE